MRRGMALLGGVAALALLAGCGGSGAPGPQAVPSGTPSAPASAAPSSEPSGTPSSEPISTPSAEPALFAHRYRSKDFGFELGFPAKPESSTTRTTMNKMNVTVEVVQYAPDDGSTVFAEVVGFPRGALELSAAQRKALLTGSLEGLAASLGGVVDRREWVELEGASLALRAQLSDSEGESGTGQFLAAVRGDREYLLLAFGIYADRFEEFIDSLRFTD